VIFPFTAGVCKGEIKRLVGYDFSGGLLKLFAVPADDFKGPDAWIGNERCICHILKFPGQKGGRRGSVNDMINGAVCSVSHDSGHHVLYDNQFVKKPFITEIHGIIRLFIGQKERFVVTVSPVRKTPDKNFYISGTVVKYLLNKGIENTKIILIVIGPAESW
jgi:hypothetical protein